MRDRGKTITTLALAIAAVPGTAMSGQTQEHAAPLHFTHPLITESPSPAGGERSPAAGRERARVSRHAAGLGLLPFLRTGLDCL